MFFLPYLRFFIDLSYLWVYYIIYQRTFLPLLAQALYPWDSISDYKNEFNKMDIIGNAKKYIREHYQDSGLSLKEVARGVNIRFDYLSSLFKKKTGISFTDYITDLRLHFAKYLLNNTGESVKSVCFTTGFGTYRHFVRVFLNKEKVTPSRFRSINRKIYLSVQEIT